MLNFQNRKRIHFSRSRGDSFDSSELPVIKELEEEDKLTDRKGPTEEAKLHEMNKQDKPLKTNQYQYELTLPEPPQNVDTAYLLRAKQ